MKLELGAMVQSRRATARIIRFRDLVGLYSCRSLYVTAATGFEKSLSPRKQTTRVAGKVLLQNAGSQRQLVGGGDGAIEWQEREVGGE